MAKFQTKVGCFKIALLFPVSKNWRQLCLYFLLDPRSLVLHDELNPSLIRIVLLHRDFNSDEAVLAWKPDSVGQKFDQYLLNPLSVEFEWKLLLVAVILDNLDLFRARKRLHYFNDFANQIPQVGFFKVAR